MAPDDVELFGLLRSLSAATRADLIGASHISMLTARGGRLARHEAALHEEAITWRLALQIATAGTIGFSGFDIKVEMHSRSLEGVGSKGVKASVLPSGADLQLALQFASGKWLNLLLQAKRLYPSGSYNGWKSSQLDDLRKWADREDQLPAMLLYNGPYGAYDPSSGVAIDFSRCCNRPVRQANCGVRPCLCFAMPGFWEDCSDRHGCPWSPLGITILPLLPVGDNDWLNDLIDATPSAVGTCCVAHRAMPWECLACRTGRSSKNGGSSQTGDGPYLGLSDSKPSWVQELENRPVRDFDLPESEDEIDTVTGALGFQYSIAISRRATLD